MKTRWIAAATTTAALTALLCASAFAFPHQDQGNKMDQKKMSDKQAMMQKMRKMEAKGPVYVCMQCKTYYTPGMAKKMSYMDPMGHKLVKMEKAPKGMKMAGQPMKMKMGDKPMKMDKTKMDKMKKMDNKMKGDKPM